MPQAIGQLIINAAYWLAGAEVGAAAVPATAAGTAGTAATGAYAAGSAVVFANVTVAQLVGTIALQGISIGLSMALVQTPKPSIAKVNVKSPVQARRRAYGTVRLGGAVVFIRRSVVSDGDGIIYIAVALHTGEIDSYLEHFLNGQEVRLGSDTDLGAQNGITQICFDALAEAAKPAASYVVITAYDPGYTAVGVTAHYTIGGSPTTLDAISVGVAGGTFRAVVFPAIPEDSLKPTATGVTFSTTGGGTGFLMYAKPNSAGKWDGGHLVLIAEGGTGYADTVGGYGVAIYPQPNGAGRWDGGCTPDNVTIGQFGANYTDATVITATWDDGVVSGSMEANNHTVGTDTGDSRYSNIIYPGVWLDNNRVSLNPYLGLETQEADPLLMEGFPGLWTDRHRLDGIAYVVVKAKGVTVEDFSQVYSSGVPQYTGTIRASKVFDPRDPAQSYDDPDTWTWTENAALIIMDYLTHPDGMRLPYSMIETALDDWIIQADYADEEVELLSGFTEARYRLSLSYDFTEMPKNVLGKMLNCVDGRLRLREDGAIVLDLGKFDCPTSCETIGDDDIIAYQGLRRGAPKTELKNEIRATYTSYGHGYIEQEADPWRDEDSILFDGLASTVLDLTYCPSHRQARARMKIEACRLNPEWQGQIITNARGLRLMGVRYARFKIDELGINETFFIKRSDIDMTKGVCTFDVISFPAECYCLLLEEQGVSPEIETPGDHGVVVKEGAISVKLTAIGGGGGGSQDGRGGGGGGAMAIKTMALTSADWGTSIIRFHVGRGGNGETYFEFNLSEDGEDSTITATLSSGAVAMVAGGGKDNHAPGTSGAGGVATGGDTNINGNNKDSDQGGASASGAIENEFPGGGGHCKVDGGDGQVIVEFTF